MLQDFQSVFDHFGALWIFFNVLLLSAENGPIWMLFVASIKTCWKGGCWFNFVMGKIQINPILANVPIL